MTTRADELFIKNFLKFLASQGGGALKPVGLPDAVRMKAFETQFKKEITRIFLVRHDARRMPDVGTLVAHRIDDAGYGLVVSTTGFMFVEKDLRADFISWYDTLDLMDYFKKEVRPTFWGWFKCAASFYLLYISSGMIGRSFEAQNSMGAFWFFTDFVAGMSAGLGMIFGLILFLISLPASLWAFNQILGPKKLFFGDEKRWWKGSWFLNRDQLFMCLRRGAVTWEKAQSVGDKTSPAPGITYGEVLAPGHQGQTH